jgi:hypothetical protein
MRGFGLLASASDYAQCMLDPGQHFPAHDIKTPGLLCVRPFEYAAVALQLSGANDAAPRAFDRYRQPIVQPDGGVVRVTRARGGAKHCRAERLASWIQG